MNLKTQLGSLSESTVYRAVLVDQQQEPNSCRVGLDRNRNHETANGGKRVPEDGRTVDDCWQLLEELQLLLHGAEGSSDDGGATVAERMLVVLGECGQRVTDSWHNAWQFDSRKAQPRFRV